MTLDFFLVDSFTEDAFKGNPAGVVLLKEEIDESVMQSIASEVNLSETAFVLRTDEGRYKIRWFTPTTEVNLCGHATLAVAKVLNDVYGILQCFFDSRMDNLFTRCNDGLIELLFPTAPAEVEYNNKELLMQLPDFLCAKKSELLDYVVVELASIDSLYSYQPDKDSLLQADKISGLILTCRDEEYDFVSRFFDPWEGILEDPVTGSAHCVLTPYWRDKLGMRKLNAYQASTRGGSLFCEDRGDVVSIKGNAKIIMKGKIEF